MKNYPSKAVFNRELSWLRFNSRLLQEGDRKDVPLFERAHFIGIQSSNLDEFFSLRLAALLLGKQEKKRDDSGLKAKDTIKRVYKAVEKSCREEARVYRHWEDAAKKAGMPHMEVEDLTGKQRKRLKGYFKRFIVPGLSPTIQKDGHGIFANGRLYMLVSMKKGKVGIVGLPPLMDRIIDGQAAVGQKGFLLLEDVIRFEIDSLFSSEGIKDTVLFRVTKSAKVQVEEENHNPLMHVDKGNQPGVKGRIVRIEIEARHPWAVDFLKGVTGLKKKAFMEIAIPLDLSFMTKWKSFQGGNKGLYKAFEPTTRAWWKEDLFQAIRKKDRLHSLPYESSEPVLAFLEAAVRDPQVVAIWQTLYGVSKNAPLVEKLRLAALKGKQVTLVIQKAGADSGHMLAWAEALQEAGCQVIFGHPAYKVHAKVLMVVRREERGLRSYVHMSTGNYNEITGGQYTDFGYFTASEPMGRDILKLFRYLTGAAKPPKTEALAIAPFDLRETLMQRIQEMIVAAKRGEPAWIFLKMNALVDTEMINALYQASQAGVKVDCLIRGVCCLRPGIAGISENIQVKSIVGRFVEHQRVFCFATQERDMTYLSSADWMPENLNRQVELLFPVEDKGAKTCIKDWMKLQWQDENRAYVLDCKGRYHPLKRGAKALDSQMCLMDQ